MHDYRKIILTALYRSLESEGKKTIIIVDGDHFYKVPELFDALSTKLNMFFANQEEPNSKYRTLSETNHTVIFTKSEGGEKYGRNRADGTLVLK